MEDLVLDLPMDQLAKTYVKIRDERTKLKSEFDEKDNQLKEQMTVLEQEMLNACNKIKADSIRTAHGTIIRSIKSRYWTNDWNSMYQFIVQCDSNFKKNPQFDGEPNGIEHDIILKYLDDIGIKENRNKTHIVKYQKKGNLVVLALQFGEMEYCTFELSKQNGKWLIDKINGDFKFSL